MTADTVEILRSLIGFPTVSRASNLELIAFIGGFLAERGIEARLFADPSGAKASLFATIGPPDQAGIVLSGHTDVVPVEGQSWNGDPFRLTHRDGKLYGRGTADMKGFLACALRAAALAVTRPLRRPLHLAFSYDEEIGCVGVRPMLAQLAAEGFKPALCLIGEPTSLRIGVGHKGKMALQAICRGKEGHSAMAPLALNAIHLACDFVALLREEQARLERNGARDEAYEVACSTLHVGRIEGGTALNIVPGQCRLDFEIRHLARDSADAILTRLREGAARISAEAAARFPGTGIEIAVVNAYPGLDCTADDPAAAFVRSLTGANDQVKLDFGTEGGLFREKLDIPTVICGPGSMDQGHKPDEFITLDQLAACDRMMDKLVDRLTEPAP